MVTLPRDISCDSDDKSVLNWYRLIQDRVRVLHRSKQEDAAQEAITRLLTLAATGNRIGARRVNQIIWQTIRSFRGNGKTERIGNRDFSVEIKDNLDLVDYLESEARNDDDLFVLCSLLHGNTRRELSLQMEVPRGFIDDTLDYLEGCYDRHQAATA